ncbi:MAG: cyclase family protein [Pirellulaceae bacterium]
MNHGYDLIDLSVPLADNAVSEPFPATIEYIDHQQGGEQMQELFGLSQEDLIVSDGGGWAIEKIEAITHTGTHVDAPYHYGPKSNGVPARRIDAVPLEWCFAPGVLLDVRSLGDGKEITVDFMRRQLDEMEYAISGNDIILLQTGCDKHLDSPEYFKQPGLGREGTLWLVEQGVHVIGIDAYTLDRPFHAMKSDFEETGNGDVIWPAHFAGITSEYCQIEKLANLEKIPVKHGFLVSCLPVKIAQASAAWCRAVAMVPKSLSLSE